MSKSQQGSSSEDVQSLIIFLPKNLGLARQRRLQQLQAEGLLEVYSKKTQQPTRLSDCSECWNVILVCHAKKSEVHVRICIYIYIYIEYMYIKIYLVYHVDTNICSITKEKAPCSTTSLMLANCASPWTKS